MSTDDQGRDPAAEPIAGPGAHPGGARPPAEHADPAGDPDRMAQIQRERARAEGGARAGARRGWRLRERASDAGARDRLARMFDRGRDPAGAGTGTGRTDGAQARSGRPPDRSGGLAAVLERVRRPAGAGGVPPEAAVAPRPETAPSRPHGGDGQRPGRRRGHGRGEDGGREASMVPGADFRSYYGRPVLKTPIWKDDVAYYLFLGGLSAASSMLAAGADLTGRPALRRGSRIGGLVSIVGGTYFLVVDLGRPERFHHMLRVFKPTSPLSVGTWVLSAYAPGIGLAAASELMPARLRTTRLGRLVELLARPAGLYAAALAPAVASYTAVLLSHTAVPAWHEAHEELPFIFTASAAASAGGLGMLVAPISEAAPARRMATYGAIVEMAASLRLERREGLVGEAYEFGEARRYLDLAAMLTAGGTLGGLLLGRRSRAAAALSGVALLAGGLCERLGLLHAGIQSTQDPKYVVEPQRQRIAERTR